MRASNATTFVNCSGEIWGNCRQVPQDVIESLIDVRIADHVPDHSKRTPSTRADIPFLIWFEMGFAELRPPLGVQAGLTPSHRIQLLRSLYAVGYCVDGSQK